MALDIKVIVNPVYEPYLDCEAPRQIFFGGSSSGKSVFAAQRCILDVLSKKRNYLIVRNVAKTIRQSFFNELCKAINEMGINSFFNINRTDMVITSVSGYQILSAGLDDPQKVKSITPVKGVLTDILIEEATEVDYNSFKELTKRLRGKSEFKGNKRITLLFNPILKTSWIYEEFFNEWQDDKREYITDDLTILKTTYVDNSFLTDEDIKLLENESDEYFYNVYTLGNWGILGAVIFKNWRVEDCTEIRKTADNYKNGCDFGFSVDPATVVRTHYDKKRKTIYILDEFYQTGLTNDLFANEIKNIIGYEYITCDSSEPKSIQELKNHGISALGAKKGKDSVNYGIQWLQQQTIIIDPKCQNTKNEFSQYKWKEDARGNVLTVPVDKNNHCIDALRYAYEDEWKQKIGAVTVNL